MNKCPNCNIYIRSKTEICPLCHNEMNFSQGTNIFPFYQKESTKVFLTILAFLSLLAILVCLFLNIIINKCVSWSLFVISGIGCLWLTMIVALKSQKNVIKLLFLEIFLINILAILWDYFTNFHLWSLTFVIPSLTTIYAMFILIIQIFAPNTFKVNLIYIILNTIIGLIPVVFIILDIIKIKWPSFISVFINIIISTILLIFHFINMKDELKRRLHI